MYIHIDKKIIFLSNHKTASKSTEDFILKNSLYHYSYKDLREIFPSLRKTNTRHISMNDLLYYLKHCKGKNADLYSVYQNISEYKIFVFTRNVENRCKSLYFYQSSLIKKYTKNYPKDMNNAIQQMIQNNNYRFCTFIFDERGILQHPNMIVFKMEEMETFLQFVRDTFNIDVQPISHKNKSRKKEESLTEQTRKMIQKYFYHEYKLYQ